MSQRLHALSGELKQKTHYTESDYEDLAERLGESLLCDRLEKQLKLYRDQAGRGAKIFRSVFRKSIVCGLFLLGQLAKARKLARSPQWVEQHWSFPRLPPAFDGFRILHLSDFHFDFIPELPAILEQMLSGKHFDCCVLTGDFRGETTGPYMESVAHLERCRPFLGREVYAVLGNHDNVELLLKLPELGIRLLMNEAVELKKDGACIRIAGLDDPHFYQRPDLNFLAGETDLFTILLSHSPESWRGAQAAGVDLQLSGHTHGGQLCLPGGIPVLAHLEDCPREMVQGRWQAGDLRGYTSRGVGSSSLDLRLNCPPEITLHILNCSVPGCT
ncbi:MAG: metallophosphoesterase [Kiritimatiellia bacterium]